MQYVHHLSEQKLDASIPEEANKDGLTDNQILAGHKATSLTEGKQTSTLELFRLAQSSQHILRLPYLFQTGHLLKVLLNHRSMRTCQLAP